MIKEEQEKILKDLSGQLKEVKAMTQKEKEEAKKAKE
jgi:hypothetical protein